MSDIKTTFTIFCYSFLFFRFCDFFLLLSFSCLFPNFCLYFPYICNVYFTLRIIIYLIYFPYISIPYLYRYLFILYFSVFIFFYIFTLVFFRVQNAADMTFSVITASHCCIMHSAFAAGPLILCPFV